jgi:signal transduction histidine kinase
VGQLIEEMREIVRASFPPGITLEVAVTEPLWSVQADPIQLHQVLMNLCLNARDAMPVGGTLTLGAANVELTSEGAKPDPALKAGRYVRITVKDTGVGIPKEVIGRVFDPFFSTKAAGEGTGLGLSTVFGIVKGHGGAVAVESQPKCGTTFTVLLPAGEEPVDRRSGLDRRVG